MRKRFKSERLCSSDNYKSSKRAHIEFIHRWHDENIVEITRITSIIPVERVYVKCFGRLIEITPEEALKMNGSIEIIIK